MGLDQYAYVASQANLDWNGNNHRELSYWRKHPNLQGWMENLWNEKGRPGIDSSFQDVMFNGIEVELTWEDLDRLEDAIRHKQLPQTRGFFFGEDSDDEYLQNDLEFVRKARAELFLGLRVFYNSSW